MAVVRPMPMPAVLRPAEKIRQLEQAQAETLAKFRRCTFRRIEATSVTRALAMYDVQCLYPDRVTPLPLGDLAVAHPVCASCTYQGIFRPDAD
jgi:hypothetical protein